MRVCVFLNEDPGTENVDQEESEEEDEDDDPVVSYSKLQRWPEAGEPVCVVCGRYGAYIVDRTDKDVCSLECKARHLMKLGITVAPSNSDAVTKKEEDEGEREGGEEEEGDASWVYREHPEVAEMSENQVERLREKVR